MAVISGLIPSWKLMKDCHMRLSRAKGPSWPYKALKGFLNGLMKLSRALKGQQGHYKALKALIEHLRAL